MKIIKIILLIPMLLFFCGCPFYSEYPLGEPGKEKIDKKLVGTWITDTQNKEVKKIKIDKRSKFEYTVKVVEAGEKYLEETYDFNGWVTEIKGRKFLYLEPQQTKAKAYYYYAYEMNKKGFSSYEISDQLIHRDDIHSRDELRKLVETHISDKGFLSPGVQWTKSK